MHFYEREEKPLWNERKRKKKIKDIFRTINSIEN
jgi:hypothetical protein